jgi:hypothetical protein
MITRHCGNRWPATARGISPIRVGGGVFRKIHRDGLLSSRGRSSSQQPSTVWRPRFPETVDGPSQRQVRLRPAFPVFPHSSTTVTRIYMSKSTGKRTGRRQRLWDAGLCITCAKNPRLEGHSLCRGCTDYQRDYNDRVKRLGSVGLCLACGIAEHAQSETLCVHCLKDRPLRRARRHLSEEELQKVSRKP